MANLFQAWDEDIQALGAAKASDQQIEARRQQLAEHFKAKAKAAGLSSKKINETLDQFDTYSRQNSTNEDNRLSPEEEEMAQRVKDGTERTGAMLEVGKRFKDIGLGALSSLTRMGGDVAQTWADVGDNDKSELSSQIAQGLYNATDDIRSNYSEGTKRAKKNFWSPEGLTMGLAENLGQIAGSATVFGAAGKLAAARGLGKAATLATMGAVGAPLAYSQGYGQGKENSLDEINKTSNAQLWENVKAEAKAYDDAGGTGEVPYLVSMFKEAGGDLNLMKDLMAENAGNVTGLMTVATEPLAMGVGSLMSRGAAAGGKGLRAGLVNIMNNQGMSNELARRIAAGGSAGIASQVAKIGLVQGMRGTGQEGAQEGGEGYIAKTEGSLAAGRKGELTGEDWRGEHGIIQQGLQGAAIGGIMAGGSVYSSARNASKLALEKNGLPEKHDAAIIAKEQADINLAKATEILDLNPEDVKAQEVHAKAYDEALVATNNLEQLTGKFNALYTPEEQAVIKAKTMEGVAARAKVAEDAAKAQKELDDAQAKAAQEQQAQQNEIIKAQRENTVNKLASMVGDEVALNEELARLNLGADEKNALVTEAHKVAKKQKKAEKQAQNQAQAKTPLDSALDMLFDAKGNRNNKDAQDAADTHKIQLVDLVPAIAQRIESNKQQQSQVERQNKKAEYEKTKVREAEQAANKEKLTDKQQLENTLADFAANNDHDSMVNFLRDYDPKEADTLIANAYKTVANRTKAEQDAITASQKAEAAKAKKTEDDKQAEQKKIAFNNDMADLYAANPDRNPTKAELDSVGKKHGVKSPIELAKAWVKVKNEAKAAKEAAPKLALPSPETATKDERDITVPTGLNINRDNIENQDRRPVIVRNDGQPFQTQAAAEQALKNKSTKKPRKNEAPITPETHKVISVNGGYAIAPTPVVDVEKPKKPDDNEDGGVIADAPKPNAPVSPTGQQVVDSTPTQSIEGEYQHNKIESAKATVTKTDKGYDIDWGDEVQSFTGKNAQDKTLAALKSEDYTKLGQEVALVVNDVVKPPKKESPTPTVEQKTNPKPAAEQTPVIDQFANNTLVTKDMAEAAIARIKAKMNRLNSGFDPELFTDGVIVAVAYIESGVRQFSDFSKTMIDSMGDNIKPYLLSFWEGARSYPNLNTKGMTDTVESKRQFDELNKTVAEKSTPSVIEPTPTTTTGQQIAGAMDKTATAITEAAHNKVVERIRKGEEIVYKQPAAIERVKQDDRYQVEINDKGHAVVKNIKDSNGEWVNKPQANVEPTPKTEAVHIENGKAEEVTPEIIRESLAKVDDKPINGLTMSLKEAKQWLLDQVTVAISVAKYKSNDDVLGKNGEKNPKSTDYVAFDVPNDGLFKVLNSIESLQKFKKKVEANRGFDKQSPKKLFPAVPQNSVDTTIAEFLGDGEVENAYEFAKLQDRPIRFGVGNSQGRENTNAYALTEPVDLGGGFKGFVGLSLDTTKKQWIFIEENTRLSIGLFDDTKDKAIKNAKDKLAGLSESDKAKMLVKAKETKIKKTDAELEQQWLSQIGYNPNQNEDEVKTDVKAKVEDKQNKAIGDEILNQQPKENTVAAPAEKTTEISDEAKAKTGIIKEEYPTAIVLNGWQNSVRNANEVVRSFKRAYEDYINEAYNGALSQAETDAQKKVLERESLKLQKEYIKRVITLAKVRSGVTSSFIAGGSNFNNKQAQNRGNAFDKASRDFENWLLGNKYTLSTAVQEARSPEQLAAIKAEKDAKEKRAQDKNDDFLRKVLSFKKGDDFKIGQYKVVRVNLNKYGMPISLTLEGVGITKGLNDKISLFGKDTSYETVDDLKQNIERIKEADSSIVEEKSKTGLIDEDKLKNLEISVNDFISANGLDPDNYDFMFVGETQEKTKYQVLINEMLGVVEKHIADAESKFTSTPEQRKQKAKTLSTWTGARDAIQVIAAKRENPFLTSLVVRTQIPVSLKTRFQEKFANLSDSEKYMQYEEQARLSAIHRANKAIEWVLKEKSKEADNAIADKAQPQQPALKKGEVDYKFSSGEVVLTATGRETTPFPKVDLSTNRKATNSLKVIESWLMDNAIAEAKARGDEFNLLQFNASRNKPQQADKDSAEMYLFDSRSVQPIPAPFMRQLVAGTTEPTPVTQPESKSTPVASTSSNDLTDKEYIALKKAYNEFKAKTDKIGVAHSRDEALKIATGLVAEMPDKEDKIRQALIDAIRENQWNRFEINFPKQPIKVETDVELNRALKRLQKALEGTDYTVNGTFNGKSAKLLFSYKTGANGSRESVLIDRVNGKFTSYHVDFDNMSREFLKPLMDATVKWLNGEEILNMKLGEDSQWDYTTLLSTPRHIDNAFNEAKANAPTAAPVSKSDKLAQSFDEAKAKQQPAKEEAPKQETNSKTPTLDKHNALMDSVRDGKATAEDFKQSFADISTNKDAILTELNALTKDQLLKEGGYAVQYRHKNDKKSEVAEAVYHSMITEYALGRGITYGMGKNSYENAVQKMIESTDQQRLDEFAQEYKQMIDGRISDLKAKAEALENPQTLSDFMDLMRSIMAEGKSRQEAFLTLTPEQRIKYDELEAESTKEARETRKRAAQASINTSSQTTDGKIIETKHTRDGYDLFVVQLSDRLSTDDYKKVLSEAKKLGGWYSSYNKSGAIVGFQFKDKEAAQAFLALAGGDTTAAKEQLSQKQDDYADNRSQSAAERLLDMAEKIETKANEELDRDRKANTARRARFAASAENEARAKIALAKTMRNIAEAIKNGKAKFLDNIRMKVDVEALRTYITTAKDNEIRSEYDSYAEQVKRKGQPPTAATADFATYPTYTLFRSDLAFLGRQLLEIDGLKKLGQQIMMVADDVSDAYLEFAKKNLYKVSRFQTKDSALATFSSKETAERAIKKSGLTGKAIVLQVKRGENIVILSPSEAINLKVWEGDADKRITLKREFGNQLVESVGRRAGKNNRLLPYQFQYAYDKLKALSRIGIETPSEFRSALREFIALQEQVVNNKVREMELAMVGRKNDGLDFFPTSPAVVAEMLDAAEIQPGMRVLEPSAGMGHIADQIREQAEIDPDVVEFSPERRELLKAKGHNVIGNDFLEVSRKDALPVSRSELVDIEQFRDAVRGDVLASVRSALYWFDRGDYEGAASLMDRATRQAEFNEPAKQKFDNIIERLQAAAEGQYDRIIMNPPFSNRQDAEHVRHAYELLRPNGRIVAIMGEGVFFGSDKKAVEFREWLESVGGTSEKLPDNSFMDSSLPVNTGVNARMVIIDKQDNDNQTNEDKPKFSRKATESDSVPIYRIDNKNFDANNIKPHGLYVSIPSDVSTFDSPHKDVGDTSFAGNASPKNPLNVESFKIQHKRGNDYPMEVSAGVSALKQLVSVQLFERLIKADKAELTATIKEQFPDIDTSQYYDAYELLEVLGAQLAIQEGYDAIIQKNGNDPFNEMVILDNSIIESMSPTDKPKNSKGTGTGLTTTQVRATLVDRFGEKLIKALESSGLLKILETMGDIPSQALKSIQAFHGTPYHFDRFSLSHLGKGEGAQAYGWGLYFAGNKKIAEWYRETLTRPELDKVAFKGKEYGFMDKDSAGALALVNALVDDGFSRKHSIAAIMAMREHSGANLAASFYTYNIENKTKDQNEVLLILNTLKYQEPVKKGQLYKVNISQQEESFLDYDKSLDEQTPYVRDILSKLKSIASLDHRYAIGANFYHALRNEGKDKVGKNPTDKEVSLYLNSIGIHGIKYLDGTSRFAGEGNYNYVIFDDAAVDIVETFYSENPNGIEGYYHNGQATLIADNLTPETVVATFVHELGGHKGFQELMTPTAYDSLMRQFNRLVKQGNPIALAAKARAEAAESTDAAQQDEMLPYLLTQQATLNATRTQQSAVAKVIEQVYRAVKAWLYRTLSAHGFDGLASRLLQPKDITLLAERMIREMGNGTKPTSNKAKGLQFSQLNTPQTQINAVRKKYEGTSQWMKAPNGQPTKLNEMQWAQVRTDNFKNWFGDWENDPANASKVVDENGEPKVVYHGTGADFDVFNADRVGQFGKGVYFTNVNALASNYASGSRYTYGAKDPKPNVIPVYLDIKNPFHLKGTQDAPKKSYLNKNKHDGIIYDDGVGADGKHYYEYVAFNPTQIKSAIGNNGEFSPTNPDIRFSRKAKNPITEGIKTAANDAKNSLPKPISGKIDHFLAGRRLPSADMANIVSKTELSLYHRTISTQQNTALQLPDFKKVYDMAQRYLQHVSVDAYAALQAAPNLLGQLESWSDLKKEFRKAWPATYIKQKTDRAAVAAVIFDETLNNELLSEEDILKALSRDQRKIYKEARDAIEVSLKNTAKSEMVRKLLAAEAINWTTVEDLMDKNLPVEQFAQSVRDLVESRIGGLSNELEAILDSDKMVKKAFKTGEKEGLSKEQKTELKKALAVKAQIDTTKEALKSLNDVEKRLDTLLEQGYAPLMRFGEYTLTVRGLDDKVKSFFMFETKAEQARAANAIVARYGKTVKLETDMISKEEFKQFAGMTPETMALFAKETGMDKDEAYQHYLKLAIPARSAMTRMIKRKGTEGFSDDIQRVVASFVMSNARMAAKNIYAAQIEKSIQAIESGKSVKDQAIVMKENVFNPKENFAQLRNILFLWNLGGSIFFGLLNMTQPYLQTLPHLSQYVSIADAGRAILRGSKIAGVAMKNGHAPRGYEEEYNRAVREGHVDPQNVFMLSGVERGKTGLSNSWTSVASHLMGSIAQVTESFNRKAVFIASIDVANKKGAAWLKKHGFDSAYDFAVDSIAQTQGVYNKANRSNWANTSVGAPLMTFKQYSINYVEQMVRMWRKKAESGDEGKKAVFLMLAMLASLSGVLGLPFMKDILDASETTAAFLGNPVNIEREARLVLGKDLADPLFNGVLNHFVFNQLGIDTQSRTSMGDLIPLSNIFNPTLSSQGRANELSSIAGATGGLIEKGYDATQLIARGNIGTAALTLMPRSLTSAFTGAKMALTDEVMDSKGNKVFDTTWDEGLIKAIDAAPKRMADLSRTKSLEWKDFAIQDYMTTSFKQKIIAAMMDKDQSEVNKLMKEVEVWNNARSRYPVYIDLNTLAENANKKDQTFDAREKIRKGMTWVKNERPEM